jgi:DNA invertase Pin-like site-specific DNA recombinase
MNASATSSTHCPAPPGDGVRLAQTAASPRSVRSLGQPPDVLVDGYVRVSQVAGRGGERFISPTVQREQIEGWATANAVQIGQVFEELDESGARSDRPLLIAALERIECGASQGIVVAKLDRFGRSLVDGLAKIDRIAAAGGTFVSVQDGLDLSTPTGKLVLRIMFSMAEWELDRVRANWETARVKAMERGVHLSLAPLGYRRRADGRLVVEPAASAIVAEVFKRRGEGATIDSLIDFLDASGLETKRGSRHFVVSSVKGILTNRTYLGEARWGTHLKVGAHAAIVDDALWHRAQRPTRFQSNRRTSLLGGILRCGSCRLKMSVESGVFRNTIRGGTYRCPGRTSAGACPDPARVRGEEIEALVEDFVLGAAERLNSRCERRIALAEVELAKAKDKLSRYRDRSGALTVLTPENFAAGLAKRQSDVEIAAIAVADARRTNDGPRGVPANLESSWPTLSIAERREVIDEFLDCVFVMAGTEPVVERSHVYRRGCGPPDVPRRGVPLGEIEALLPSRHPGSTRLSRPRAWNPTRIEAELLDWRGTQDEWPSYVEFLLGGRARLHEQILGYGGTQYWARRLSWSRPPRATVWNPELIRGGLRPILTGRAEWPSAAEFESLGLGGLRRAVIRHGGITHWAAVSGLRLRPGTGSNAGPGMNQQPSPVRERQSRAPTG